MSLSCRPEQQLRRVKVDVCRSDRHLAAMFDVFGGLNATTACLPGSRWPRSPPAGAASSEALAAPRRSAAAARSARAHAHRVMTAHPIEVAARARRNTEGSPSGSSFRGQPPGDARLLRAESATLPVAICSRTVTGPCPRSPGRDPPRTGRTHPDAATLCRPRKSASRRHIAATGYDWPLRQIRTRPSAGDGLVRRAALTPRAWVPAHHIAATGHDWPLRRIRTRPSRRDDGVIALVGGKQVHARPHRENGEIQRSPRPVLQRAASRWHLLKDTGK